MEHISWRDRARQLKQEIRALMIAIRDPRVPWYARLLGIGIIAYALSPLDLIPDPIPILGYLDDIIILPLAILLVLRLIPPDVMAESRKLAAGEEVVSGRLGWIGTGLIVLLWVGTVALLLLFASRFI